MTSNSSCSDWQHYTLETTLAHRENPLTRYYGSVVFVYGAIDDAVKEAIQNAPLEMEGSFLKMEAKLADGDEFNIVVSKAR